MNITPKTQNILYSSGNIKKINGEESEVKNERMIVGNVVRCALGEKI